MLSLITISRPYKTNCGLLGLLIIFCQAGCTKFVQLDPPTSAITGKIVFDNNTSAAAAMTSIYGNIASDIDYSIAHGKTSIGYLMGLAADELTNYDPTNQLNVQFYPNALSSISSNGKSNNYFWPLLYNQIYITNSILAGLTNSKGVSASIKSQITGEAKFMRAFLYFYLVNLYGDVPLATGTDYRVNNLLHRSPSAEIYKQIIADLKDAQAQLSDDFLDAFGAKATEKIRPNKSAATAFLARVYLYTGDWANAETSASAVIGNTKLTLETNFNNVFLKSSKEAIWQLESNYVGYNTFDGLYYVLSYGAPGYDPSSVALSPDLVNAFEAGDKRRTNWIGEYTDDNITYYYYPYKYKISDYDETVSPTEYVMVLRLAEQYLIRAEARAQQDNVSGAQGDINTIRTRAGLVNTSASDKASLLAAIFNERRTELFTEWGHRWFDLKRSSNLNAVMSIVTPQKGGSWSPNWAVLPIPLSDLKANPNLTQNSGY